MRNLIAQSDGLNEQSWKGLVRPTRWGMVSPDDAFVKLSTPVSNGRSVIPDLWLSYVQYLCPFDIYDMICNAIKLST